MRLARFAVVLMTVAAGVAASCQFRPAEMPGDSQAGIAEPAASVRLYNADARHPWNRLHATLLVRSDIDPPLGGDDADLLLWRRTHYLLSGVPHERAVRELQEFVRGHAERLIEDPVKRAVFQHDLWGVYDWLADPEAPEQAARMELLRPLAEILRRLALSSEAIAGLPDNYAAARGSGVYAGAYDAGRPERAFLPAGLTEGKEGWTILGDERRELAPMHQRLARGRSVFVVLMRLPGGREATERYLQALREFSEPWETDPLFADFPENRDPFRPSGKAPQFPAGTQVALVRRMVVIDDHGGLRATRLVESVQLRVYVKEPATTRLGDSTSQDAYEWGMSRGQLFSGEAGGLTIDGGERIGRFISMISAVPDFDPLDDPRSREDYRKVLQPLRPSGEMRAGSCFSCHASAGIGSMASYTQLFADKTLRAPHFSPQADTGAVAERVLRWKRTQYEMGMLRAMMDSGNGR